MKHIWKSALSGALGLVFSNSIPTLAQQYSPNWAKIFDAVTSEGYLDLNSKVDGPIQEDRHVTKEVVVLVNFKSPHGGAVRPIFSMTERVRVDCVHHQTVGLQHTYYDSPLGAGGELGTGSDNYDWKTPTPGQFDNAVWNAVCGAPRKPGQTDEQVAQATALNNADIGNSCGEPEISNSAITAYLNTKIGQFGGPSRRIIAIRSAPPQPNDTSDRHTRCHGTLVFAGGTTEVGLLLEDRVNGVSSWRWHSDEELAQGANSPAQKKVAAQIDDEMRKNAEQKPNETVACGVEGPQTVYTTWAVCYSVIKLVRDNEGVFKPYAGYALLKQCGQMESKVCISLVSELQALAGPAGSKSKMDLIGMCANDIERRVPGREKPQYMNTCQDLIGYFR